MLPLTSVSASVSSMLQVMEVLQSLGLHAALQLGHRYTLQLYLQHGDYVYGHIAANMSTRLYLKITIALC